MKRIRDKESNRSLARVLCERARTMGIYDMRPLKPDMPSHLSTLQRRLGKVNAFSGNTLKKIVDTLLTLIEQHAKRQAAS